MRLTAAQVRKAVKAAVPDLKFTVRKVSFLDLARAETFTVESDAWGMTRGGQDVYNKVSQALRPFGSAAVVVW